MSYNPVTDFLALSRLTSGGLRTERMPGLDYVVSALARSGMFKLSVSDTAPTSNQPVTAWFRPANPSWASEGVLYLWNAATSQYEVATAALWSALFAEGANVVTVQQVTSGGPVSVQVDSDIVLVEQVIPAPITLVMPLSSLMLVPVLILDWKGDAGTNNITVNLTAPDTFPGGLTSWKIADDTGSIFLRPMPGIGYAL